MSDLTPDIFGNVRLTRKDKAWFNDIAKSWGHLQNYLYDLTEEDLVKMMRWELDGPKRLYHINRIKGRHNRLRDQRERSEILIGL